MDAARARPRLCALRRRYPKSLVVALDFSPRMLQRRPGSRRGFAGFPGVRRRRAPAARRWQHRFDSQQSHAAVVRSGPGIRRVSPGAGTQWLLTFTTLVRTPEGTAKRVGTVDSHTHVNQFIDMHDIGDSLVRNGFAAPVLDVERYTLSYLDVRKLAADLKATGARNATFGGPRPHRPRAICRTSEGLRGLSTGRPFAGDLRSRVRPRWRPDAAARRHGDDGSTVSLAQIKEQLRSRRRP